MAILLAILFILGDLIVALGLVPQVTITALAILNIVGFVLILVVCLLPVGNWPWQRP